LSTNVDKHIAYKLQQRHFDQWASEGEREQTALRTHLTHFQEASVTLLFLFYFLELTCYWLSRK